MYYYMVSGKPCDAATAADEQQYMFASCKMNGEVQNTARVGQQCVAYPLLSTAGNLQLQLVQHERL